MTRVSYFGGTIIGVVAALVLGAALATLINAITAQSPFQQGIHCKRECQPGIYLTCLFEFSVHRYQTYSRACGSCDGKECDSNTCIRGDGTTRFITVVNKKLPGPTIEVCEGDTVEVKVRNDLPSEGVTLHWHGVLMEGEGGTPHMDGVPGITQCPILPGTSFTYNFRASSSGTHFWYATTGFQKADGVYGPLIVRKPRHLDEHHKLYDEDLTDHIIMINDWTHILGEEKFCLHHHGTFSALPQSLLINGMGPHRGKSIIAIPKLVPHQTFTVEKGVRYRIRLINSAFLNCPVRIGNFDELSPITLIAVDGSPVIPQNVSSITLYPGERIDVVIAFGLNEVTYSYDTHYWMTFKGEEDCDRASVYQFALFLVSGNGNAEKHYKEPSVLSALRNVSTVSSNTLRSFYTLPERLRTPSADDIIQLHFNRRLIQSGVHSHPYFFSQAMDSEWHAVPIPQINNISFERPSTPLLLQDLPPTGTQCLDDKFCEVTLCDCLHIKKIPLGNSVDLVLINQDISASNVVHLHGHRFYVIGKGSLESRHSFTKQRIARLSNSSGSNFINIVNPPRKDTVAISPNGYVIVRFLANNPGIWTLRSQLLFDSEAGMKMVFMVGQKEDILPLPKAFPRCGNYPET